MGNLITFEKRISVNEVLDALQVVQDFCDNQYQEDCDSGKCPLYKWCIVSGDRMEYPCNWSIKR